MNKLNICTLIAVLAVSYTVYAEEVPPGFAPEITCEETVYNFGEAEASETIEHTFIIKNEGNAVLDISRVRPACGCTVAELSEKLVGAGKEAKITTRLSLKGRRGHQRKSITVECNDPKKSRFMLYLEGDVTRALDINPDRLFFGQISPDTQATKTITLTSKSKTIEIKDVSCSVEQFDTVLEVTEEGKSYQILVSTKPPLNEGHVNGYIRISRGQGQPDINIPVSAVVSGPLAIAPREITLRTQNNAVTRYIVVRPGSVKEFEIEGIDLPNPDIKFNITSVGPGYRIELSNIVPSHELDGKVVKIRTNVPEKHEIIIPIKIAQ